MAWAAYIATNHLFSLQSAHIPEKTERGPHDGRCQGTVGIQSAGLPGWLTANYKCVGLRFTLIIKGNGRLLVDNFVV